MSKSAGASLNGVVALGERAGKPVRKVVTLGGKGPVPRVGGGDRGPRCASLDGYHVHAHVALAAHDRSGLERLCRYVRCPGSCGSAPPGDRPW